VSRWLFISLKFKIIKYGEKESIQERKQHAQSSYHFIKFLSTTNPNSTDPKII